MINVSVKRIVHAPRSSRADKTKHRASATSTIGRRIVINLRLVPRLDQQSRDTVDDETSMIGAEIKLSTSISMFCVMIERIAD